MNKDDENNEDVQIFYPYEVAKRFSVTEQQVRLWEKRGDLRRVNLPGKMRFSSTEIDAFIARHRAGTQDDPAIHPDDPEH